MSGGARHRSNGCRIHRVSSARKAKLGEYDATGVPVTEQGYARNRKGQFREGLTN